MSDENDHLVWGDAHSPSDHSRSHSQSKGPLESGWDAALGHMRENTKKVLALVFIGCLVAVTSYERKYGAMGSPSEVTRVLAGICMAVVLMILMYAFIRCVNKYTSLGNVSTYKSWLFHIYSLVFLVATVYWGYYHYKVVGGHKREKANGAIHKIATGASILSLLTMISMVV